LGEVTPEYKGEEFASIKLISIVLFIILGAATMVGFLPMAGSQSAPLFSNFTSAGLFPNGAFAIITTMLAVNWRVLQNNTSSY
jgi:S-methylmethionine transporter